MTHPNQLRDQLLPLVEAGKQESADLGLDTHMHAVTITRHVSPVATAPYQVDGRALIAYIRQIDAARTLTAEDLATAIAAFIHQTLPAATEEIADHFGQFSSGKSRPLSMLLTELALTGRTTVVLDAKRGDTYADWQTTTQRADPAAVAAAMAGYRTEDLSIGETAAVERGIALATYRRLYPAVTGGLADRLAARVTYLAAHLAVETTDERVYDVLRQDPRLAGFRLAVHEAQVAATKETTRRLAMRIEWALNAIALGREATAVAKLDEGDAILA